MGQGANTSATGWSVFATNRSHGDLHAEAMPGFRDWLLRALPSIAAAGKREPDEGGLNVEGLAWEPDTRTLLFGLRSPAETGTVSVIRVPVDAGVAVWTTDALEAPSILRVRLPRTKARQGIRDISYDEQTGSLLILVGRSTSATDEPFQLCSWNGVSDGVQLLDVTFRKSMKPEGVVAFAGGDERKLLIVDDRGGYAVVGYPKLISRSRAWCTLGVPGGVRSLPNLAISLVRTLKRWK